MVIARNKEPVVRLVVPSGLVVRLSAAPFSAGMPASFRITMGEPA